MSMVKAFLSGPLSIMMIVIAAMMGIMAVFMTPREEDPQIVVPMVDVAVRFPGHSPKEVEQLVTVPLERLLWQIDGVEHVYSVSHRDEAMVTVRFYVGEDLERSLVKVQTKMAENMPHLPPGKIDWAVKSVKIDDVPIVTLTFLAPDKTPFELRRLVEEVKARMDSLRNLSLTEIFGGFPREILIKPDIENLAARKLTLVDLRNAIRHADSFGEVGKIWDEGKTLKMEVGPGLDTVERVRQTVVATDDKGGITRVEDVAEVSDGPSERTNNVNVGFGPAADVPEKFKNKTMPAVTLAFSKKKGTNAVTVAENIIKEAKKLKGTVIPDDVEFIVSRNYGDTADEKINGLITNMMFSIATVVALIALTMGWREGMIVGMSVPVSFALALFVNYIFGFTINRVTLFALILSQGLVVDDPIMNVDNIQRHIRMGILPPKNATLAAVREVLPPVVMSTLAIIASFTPMFFITGMMGPYMGPMAINVPLTVTFSTLCALTFVPWLALNLLKNRSGEAAGGSVTPKWVSRLYAAAISPFLKPRNAYILFAAVAVMTCASGALMLFGVPLKMLPFDNKDELQLVLKMPEGTDLENTAAVVAELEDELRAINEVENFESYVGVNSPIDFNGLVRHYNMRRRENQADIRINLASKKRRGQQSHTIALRIRDELENVAKRHGAVLNVVEVPPGPPVLATFAVEVYGQPHHKYADLVSGAKSLEKKLRGIDPKHITEIDDTSEAPHEKVVFVLNRDKAALHGLAVSDITATLSTALNGETTDTLHMSTERNPLRIRIRLPLTARTDLNRLGELWVGHPGVQNGYTQLAELGRFETLEDEQPIYHKNLRRLVFVMGESVGRAPGEIILQTLFSYWKHPFASLLRSAWTGEWRHDLPNGTYAEWGGEGEWEITVRVFRDLGIAFGVALIGIFLLLVIQTRNVVIPIIIMGAIPLTLIGIAPGFYILNLVAGKNVSGYLDPVFFTATGMIGMIALGGIVIRNSMVLIEFIEEALERGETLDDAILQSGATRFRPIMLTALTTMLGAWPITLDPIFSGLAWALIFGLVASTFFTLLVIPTVFMIVRGGGEKRKTNAK
jgi:multidrug efflux pump subunit AcrB